MQPIFDAIFSELKREVFGINELVRVLRKRSENTSNRIMIWRYLHELPVRGHGSELVVIVFGFVEFVAVVAVDVCGLLFGIGAS